MARQKRAIRSSAGTPGGGQGRWKPCAASAPGSRSGRMNTAEPRVVRVEQVDDIAVLLAILERLRLGELLDRHFPTHHLWQGDLSFGEVVSVWLAFILSEGDHRLSHLQPWVQQHLLTLQSALGKLLLLLLTWRRGRRRFARGENARRAAAGRVRLRARASRMGRWACRDGPTRRGATRDLAAAGDPSRSPGPSPDPGRPR